MTELTVALGDRSYPIDIRAGELDAMLANWATRFIATGGATNALLVSDATVFDIYGGRAYQALKDGGLTASGFIIAPGEPSKCAAALAEGYDACFESELSRKSPIIALGGGVVGDLAGYLAATYMRGVPFIQVPTTLLAQVDSSVGGKTAINPPRAKNSIGAFYQPQAVFIDVSTLETLPDRELKAGLAEVVKYGVIRDEPLFRFLETHQNELKSKNPETLISVIESCCRIKAEIVSEDETESGVRALLNYGHTFGHAVETLCGYGVYLHGEAVAIGMRAAGQYAEAVGLWSSDDSVRQSALLDALDMEYPAPDIDPDAVRTAMNVDKKTVGKKLKLILPERIGSAIRSTDINESALMDAIRSMVADGLAG